MADFKTQITGLTSLTIGSSSNPTQDEVSQYLVDGTKEVANRIMALRPQEIPKFTKTTHDANNSGITVTGNVLSVVREHDSTSILRKCTPIDPGLRYEAANEDSLHFRSKYSPGYYIINGKLHTVPVSATSNNDSILTQTYYAINTGHSSSSIDDFPDEYEYLVVLYASMRSLQNIMGSLHDSFITDGTVFTALTNVNTALDRIPDQLYDVVENYDIVAKRHKQVKTGIANALKLFDGDYPSNLTDLSNFLQMEDPEMIEASLMAIQMELKQAEAAMTELSLLADLPSKEAQGYMAEVTSLLGSLNQEYSWYDNKYKTLKQEYDGAFSVLAPQQAQQPQRQARG